MTPDPMRLDLMRNRYELSLFLPPLSPKEGAVVRQIREGIKEDEEEFIGAILLGVRPYEAEEALGMHPKRSEYILAKWSERGWWDWGVAIMTGWITEEGWRAIRFLETSRS